jgi:hypothetical protein
VDLSKKYSWDIAALAAALHISEEDVERYFKDGRRISFILERRFRDSHSGWSLAPSEGSAYDLADPTGEKWEMRSISSGTYFCPSYMVGSGRSFQEAGFLTKLDAIGGYICADITLFPDVPVFAVPSDLIRKLYHAGRLGAGTRISRAQFYSRIVPELNALDKKRGSS